MSLRQKRRSYWGCKMFIDKLTKIREKQDPILWAKTYHRLALQLVKNADLMDILTQTGVDIADLECGFCPCGKDLIVVAKTQVNSWSKPRYQAGIHCPVCRQQFELRLMPVEVGTSLRSADINVQCVDGTRRYQMVVRPVYLWQMESTLEDYAKVI